MYSPGGAYDVLANTAKVGCAIAKFMRVSIVTVAALVMMALSVREVGRRGNYSHDPDDFSQLNAKYSLGLIFGVKEQIV